MPARPRKKPDTADTTAGSALPNALKRPNAKGFTRDAEPKADLDVAQPPAAGPDESLRGITTSGQIATGRGATYEWEFFAQDLSNRVRAIELGGGGGGGGGGLSYVHTQSLASASWSINHALQTKPGVTVVAAGGQELLAEVHYPDDDNTVIVFSSPYAGTAYLRG